MYNVLLIFDVDGTLLLNGLAARTQFARAYTDICGVEPDLKSRISFAGNTDWNIFHKLLDISGIGDKFDDLYQPFCDRFAELMNTDYMESDEPYLLDGVPELLAALKDSGKAALALGTGNIRSIAIAKMKKFGLDGYFPAGGFGGEHKERPDVIRAAIQEAKEHYKWDGKQPETWIIGDTPRDVHAAHAVGAKCIAVASGTIPIEKLEQTDAEVVLKSLSETDHLMRLFNLI